MQAELKANKRKKLLKCQNGMYIIFLYSLNNFFKKPKSYEQIIWTPMKYVNFYL